MSTSPHEHLQVNQAALAAPQQQIAGTEEVRDEYADVFAHMRITDEARARARDVRGLWMTANNTISHLSSHFVTEPGVDFRGAWIFQLQNLWHLFYVAGKHCSEEMMAPMVLLIIETSQRGLLERSQMGEDGNARLEHAPVLVPVGNVVIQQYVWQDLPLLVPDMTTYWITDCAQMSRSQRTRISFFWASLVAASSSSWSYSLCRIALLVLRDTLEKERRLVRAGVDPVGEDSENRGRTVDMLTIADLMPAVNAWVVRAGGRLAQLCIAGDNNAAANWTMPLPEEISQLGPLAEAAGIQAAPGGFSSQRWLFWLRRLDEIGAESSAPTSPENNYMMEMPSPFVQRVREEKNLARRVAHNMIYIASQSNSPMVHELMRVRRLPIS
ncbi:hypothetical protein F5Y16DRAFT_198333 [Xylariaceae sp. FL0255]|nr:hypothetical protein F5Y16DRAFT_198333 [Xylariaceae sp. FL0255]